MEKLISIIESIIIFITFPFFSLLSTGMVTTSVLKNIDSSFYENPVTEPVNENAIPEVRELMEYLGSIYGKKILSGQYIDSYQDYSSEKFLGDNGEITALKSNELVALGSVIGDKLPAVIGLDFTGCEFPQYWHDYVTQQAIDWNERGGIVTFCWHWLVAKDVNIPITDDNRWDATMYAEDTNFVLSDALKNKSGAMYQKLLADIDAVAAQLQILEDEGVPVLWRPLHEAGGEWFWWGASGKDAYKELYNLLYERLTEYHGLDNLIWVFNAQKADWYVGDDKCDIIADDPYTPNDIKWLYPIDPARSSRFKYHAQFADNKMIMMSENSVLPDIDKAFKNNTVWLGFATWMRNMVVQADPNDQPYGVTNIYSEEYNSKAALQKVYNDSRVIKLADLAF